MVYIIIFSIQPCVALRISASRMEMCTHTVPKVIASGDGVCGRFGDVTTRTIVSSTKSMADQPWIYFVTSQGIVEV